MWLVSHLFRQQYGPEKQIVDATLQDIVIAWPWLDQTYPPSGYGRMDLLANIVRDKIQSRPKITRSNAIWSGTARPNVVGLNMLVDGPPT